METAGGALRRGCVHRERETAVGGNKGNREEETFILGDTTPHIKGEVQRVLSNAAAESRRMKVLVFALVLVLMVSCGLALDCHHCLPAKAGEACKVTTITCPAGKDACAAAKFTRAPYGHYQKCLAMSDCEMLKMNAYIRIKCCQEDLCNTF